MSGGEDKRVLLIRIGAIGNALVSVPAIRALRAHWPRARMTLVGDPVTLELLAGCPYVDETMVYDNKGGQKAGPGYARFIVQLRKRRFTHSVHFRRYLRSELMGFLSGAPERVGFSTEARVQLINKKVEYAEGESVIEQNLKLARALGAKAADRTLELWPPENSARVEAVIAASGSIGPLAVIHPAGATQRGRLWTGFAGIGRELLSAGARVVMIGAASERELVEAAAREAGAFPAIGLRLPEVALLIKKADVFCGTDSGPAHIADAVHTPGVIVYAPHRRLDRQIAKWKPEGPDYVAATPPRDCRGCGEYPCPPEAQARCADLVDPDAVLKALRGLLTRAGGR